MNNKNSLIVLFLQILQTLLSVFSLVLISKGLAVENFGTYIYIVTICSLFALFTGGGSEHVFLMNASRDNSQIAVLFGNAIILRTIFNLLIFLLCCFVNLISNFRYLEYFIFLLGYCIASYSNPLFISYYRVIGVFVKPWILSFIGPTLFLSYLIFLADYNSLLEIGYAFLFSNILMLMIFVFDISRQIDFLFNVKLVIENIKSGFVFMISQIFDFVFLRLDIFIVKIILGPYLLGIYAVGQRIISFLQVIPSSFHIVELPAFHKLANDKIELNKRFVRLKSILFFIGVIFFGLLSLNAFWLIELFFSNKYIYSKYIVYVLSLAGIINFTCYPYYMLAEALNKVNERLYLRVASLILTLILMIFFSLVYSIIGVAFAILIGNIIFIVLLHKLTHDDYFVFKIDKVSLAFICVALFCFTTACLIINLNSNSIISIVFSNLFFVSFFFILVLININLTEMNFFKSLCSKFIS
ncbi:MAG: Polysaccharide biosynthesis protein [Bacteroidota bacterium]|jgi:O-antigen/teichoic acid export membrane protein